jgi:hypothetical protein
MEKRLHAFSKSVAIKQSCHHFAPMGDEWFSAGSDANSTDKRASDCVAHEQKN